MSKIDAGIILSQHFAHMFPAYIDASSAVKSVIINMCEIINSNETDSDEREAALATLAEALFPKFFDSMLAEYKKMTK